MKRWREWTMDQRTRSAAVCANTFLNMAPCEDCGLPWAEGYLHFDCPGPLPEPEPDPGADLIRALAYAAGYVKAGEAMIRALEVRREMGLGGDA